MTFRTVLPMLFTMALGPAVCVADADPNFGAYWRDGQAELDGYQWQVMRYGQRRVGQAVLVYVTEPFSRSKLVKVDDVSKEPADAFEAFKLNVVRDFQTGIYDYNTMVSLFTRSDEFEPVKISFSSAEWCGHVYEELQFTPSGITEQYNSYFENESSSRTLAAKAGGITEEGLWILLRGLRGPFLQPGQTRTVPFLPGSLYRRLNHRVLSWTSAKIRRLEEPRVVEVPAGKLAAFLYVIEVADARVGKFYIEKAYPHRVVQWQWHYANQEEPFELGRLTGTARLKYWELHGNGDERYLKELGVKPLVR